MVNQSGYNEAFFPDDVAVPFIYLCSIFGIAWGAFCIHKIREIDINDTSKFRGSKKEGNSINGEEGEYSAEEILKQMKFCNETISEGAITFLKQEYFYISLWCIFFGIVLGVTVDQITEKTDSTLSYGTAFPYTALSFLVGASTSLMAGYIGMKIAVAANVKVTHQCTIDIDLGFKAAFYGGQVLGFMLVGLALLVLISLILIVKNFFYNPID